MGKTLGLISCTKSKKTCICSAKEMYQSSDLFRKAYNYAQKKYDFVAILSAKYGLILPDEQIEPYELTLKEMFADEKKKWPNKVLLQLMKKLPMNEISTIFFHAGIAYRKYLIKLLEKEGKECIIPLKGLGIGKQKEWYLKK